MSDNESTPDHEELDALVALELAPEEVAELAGTPAKLVALDVDVLIGHGMRALDSSRAALGQLQAMLDVLDAVDPRKAAAEGMRAAAVAEFRARTLRLMVADELQRRREAGKRENEAQACLISFDASMSETGDACRSPVAPGRE